MWIMRKAAGVFCIVAAGILAGVQLERRMRKRWQILREMQETLTFLEKEMTYHRAPVQEAFRSAAGRCATELGQVLERTAAQIREGGGQPFARMWEEALTCIPPDLFSQEEMGIFREAAAALSNTDVVMQRTLLERYADRFREKSGEEAEACREKGGLYRKLAAAAGVFLVILLI